MRLWLGRFFDSIGNYADWERWDFWSELAKVSFPRKDNEEMPVA